MMGLMLVATPAVADDGDETAAADAPQIDEGADEPQNHPALEEAIAGVLEDSELQQTDISIHVEDLTDGEILYSRQADQRMNPASNVKLLTAAVVLDQLGPNHVFSTKLITNSNSDGRLDDLYVRGEGEAFLLYEDVLHWASQLRSRGIEAIDGDVVIDDKVFDAGYLPPGFDLRDSGAAYRSPIGAVSVNFNAITAEIEPADQPGEAPTVRVNPPNTYVQVDNQAQTVQGSLPHIEVTSTPTEEGTRLTIGGTIGVNADTVSQRKRIDDPPAFTGSVIAEAMGMVGIDFDGQVRHGAAPTEGEELLDHRSAPLMEAVWAMNKWSNNFIAEQLLRVLGNDGDDPSTWEAALNRAEETLEEFGFAPDSYRLNNGSGLYDGNELTARQIVGLLRQMNTHRYGPEFASSLAIAGVDGTLAHRLDDDLTKSNLRAKTGTLRDVTALSGYMETAGGRTVAFSILFNDPPRRAWHFRDRQDDIALAIAGFDQ